MKVNLCVAKEVGKILAECPYSAFDGNVISAYINGWEAFKKLLEIENKDIRLATAEFALQEGLFWLQPGTHLNPVIAGTQESEVFWTDRSNRQRCNDTFPEVGRLISQMFALLCQNKAIESTIAFHSAKEAMAKLPDYDTRHDAISYAHQLMPLSPNAIAVNAAEDLIKAIKCNPETEADLCSVHLLQAIDSLASIDDAKDRADAIENTRQRVYSDNGPRFNRRLAKLIDPVLDVAEGLVVEPYASILQALVRPMPESQQTDER